MFEDLLQMEVSELRDLLGMLTEESHADFGVDEPAQLVGLIEQRLRTLLGLGAEADREAIERQVIGLVTGALGLSVPTGEPPKAQLDRLYEHISERVVAELAPLFQVAVSMGWADGELTEDEMLVVSSGLRRLRISPSHREALRHLSDVGGQDAGDVMARASEAADSPDRRRALLSFAWAVALADGREDPGELDLYRRLARNLEVEPDEAETLREVVTARYQEALEAVRANVEGSEAEPANPFATAALGALIASGLEDYLVSATGVIGLSMLLGVPISLHGTAAITALPKQLDRAKVAGAPGLVAGTLLVRGLRQRPALQKSLAIILACLDRRAER